MNTPKPYTIGPWRVSIVREGSADVTTPEAITTCAGAADFLRNCFDFSDEREKMIVLFLDTRNKPKGYSVVSVGSLTASIVHPREVFRPAILAGAAAVILCHNHPSGDPAPSPEDVEITRRLVAGGTLLGIRVLDHVIVTADPTVTSSLTMLRLL